MIVSGTDLMAFVGAPTTESLGDSSTAHSIGASTNHTLVINQTLKEIIHKDKGNGKWTYNENGKLDWSCTAEAFIINKVPFDSKNTNNTANNIRKGFGVNDLFGMMLDRKPVYLAFGLEGQTTDPLAKDAEPDSADGWSVGERGHYEGYAWITNITQNAPVGDSATFTVEFTGNGPLSYVKDKEATQDYSVQNPVQVVASSNSKKAVASTESK